MDTILKDALPVSISGPVGIGKVSLFDLLQQAYGDQASSIQSVRVGYYNAVYLADHNFSYWDPDHPVLTRVLNSSGASIGGNSTSDFTTVTVNAADFKDVQIAIGNNIMQNVYLRVAESTAADGSTVWRDLPVTTIPHQLTTHAPSDHTPTAADIVSTAKFFANVEHGVVNPNDCDFIAKTIAASAGATFDANTWHTDDPHNNDEGGFWRIAYRGNDSGAVPDWQSKVQAGDVVRMERTNGTVHTVTVTAGLNADGKHFGQIQVVDNMDGSGKNLIGEHWLDYDNDTKTGSITIYRLTTDDKYLTDQSTDAHGNNILGTKFNDLIKGGDGADVLRGGDGNDELHGGKGDDTLVGGSGNDILDGGLGHDIMRGGSGNDTYVVDSVQDIVDETLSFRGHPTHIDAGGIDTVRTSLSSYSLNAAENSHIKGTVENLTFIGTGNFTGTGNALDNVILGGLGEDKLSGGAGHDTLNGFDGDDRLDGGTGADIMQGGRGNDTYVVDDVGDVVSELGPDATVIPMPFGMDIKIPGDMGGIDTIETTLNGFALNAANSSSTLAWIENLTFTGTGNFSGAGNDLANTIKGGNGDDLLAGMDGNDALFGGKGNDELNGGSGADKMFGGSGNDIYHVDNAGDVVQEGAIIGSADGSGHWGDVGGIDEVRTTLSNYTLSSSNPTTHDFRGVIENLTFEGTGNFEGHGNGVDNVITGGAGADRLFGNAGDDTLLGGAGNDSLFGGTGKDILNGGTGADHLTGGAGADKFVLALGDNGVTAKTADHITDFEKGDRLDVSKFVATHATIEATRNFHGDIAQALSFANAQLAAGHNAAGSAVLADSSSHNIYVFMDQNGDHKFESAVVLDHADSHMSEIHTEIASHQLFT